MKTLLVLLRKEVLQFRRNSFLPKMIMAYPIMIMLIMPLVTTMDVRHIGIAIIDSDQSALSKRFISHISASDYFNYTPNIPNYRTALDMLDAGKIDVIVSIPKNFEKNLSFGTSNAVDVVANAVNATKGSQGMQYVLQIFSSTIREMNVENGGSNVGDYISVQNRYNPTGNYRNFMIPALMIMLLLIVCGFLPALNIVGEKEAGTIEQINVTPVNRLTFTLAKLIPYCIMGLFVFFVAMLIARLVWGLSPAGSLWTIFLGAILFSATMSGFGVMMANISDNMQQTIFLMFFFVIIFMLMSGLLTPIQSMPRWAQIITYAFPPRYFIDIMRSVYLKGTLMSELTLNFVVLAIFAVIFSLLATITYRKQN